MKLHRIYNPITATPFKCTDDYMEFAPCDALKPYIRCFWGSMMPVVQAENTAPEPDIVIPDTCMDIIFTADFTNNSVDSSFCGIDERTFITQRSQISSRQLERLYLEHIGVSPKSLAAMVRYQYLWNGLLSHNYFNIADASYQYGYSDQAHLCHDFRKYHSMSISDARKLAMQNVGNVQYNPPVSR